MPLQHKVLHERFVHHIWSKQYLQTTALTTTSGEPIIVLDTGRINGNDGPDFLNAKIKIGKRTFRGDVEIHRTSSDWQAHRHQNDPRYNSVILHVVLQTDSSSTVVESGRTVPVLALDRFLAEPLNVIWQKTILDERVGTSKHLACATQNDRCSREIIETSLAKNFTRRVELKLRRFDERIRQLVAEQKLAIQEAPRTYGEPPDEGSIAELPAHEPTVAERDLVQKDLWEQLVYEGVLEGLGYSHNQAPFKELAQRLPLSMVRTYCLCEDETRIEAALFGVAGLLPERQTKHDATTREYLDRLTTEWTAFRQILLKPSIERTSWHFFPLRPSNFPTLRIAAAAAIVKKFTHDDFFPFAVRTIKSGDQEREKIAALRTLLTVSVSSYWNTNYQFGSKAKHRITALGKARIDDIIINTLFPILLLYARTFRDRALREGIMDLYRAFPPLSQNTITQIVQQQLCKDKIILNSVERQQGAIHLYKYFCNETLCMECDIGRVAFHNGFRREAGQAP
jgi:hypothetical protein